MDKIKSMKKKRAANFSQDEKLRFLRILQAKGKIIYTKVTQHDASTNKLKEFAWEKLTLELNAYGGSVTRNTDTLKKLLQKLKSDAKVYKAKHFHQMSGTGGGPSNFVADPVFELVIEITGRGSTGIEDAPDMDTPMNEDAQRINVLQPPYEQIEYLDDNEDSISSATDFNWITNPIESEVDENKMIVSPARKEVLKDYNKINSNNTPKSSTWRKLTNERNQLVQDKHELFELQKQHLQELHEAEMRHQERLFDLKAKILEEVLKKIKDGEASFDFIKQSQNL